MELLSLRSESETSTSLFSFRISRLLKVDAPEVFCPYVECQNVRITPGQMIFDNAIEGKTFYEKITIQNLGKNPAFIRVGSANSYAFHIKPIPRGMKLSPGLILERHITFKCLRATSVSTATIPIFINDERVDYRLFVFLSATDMKAEPTSLNFGVINARNNAVIRMLSICNDGSKGSRFTIDLGRNDMDLIVEPSKGIIQPNSVTKFRVECLGTTEGNFSKEFWIKCETPLRIGVTGKVINPEVQPVHPNATSDFTLIDFPKTYVGTTFSKTFVLKNHSSSHGAFCTFIENGKDLVDFREGRKMDPSAFNFGMVPTEGIMEPFEARIFEFTYAPKIIRKKDKLNIKDLTSFCCLRITRVPFTTLPKLEAIEYDHDDSWDEILPQHIDDTVSITSVLFSLGESSLSILPSSESTKPPPAVTFHTYNTRIVLFGEAELPKIAPRTSKDASITIDNKSSSSIAVFLKSRKPVICFPSGQFVAIESMKQAKMQLSYHSSKIVGRYCVIVDCIINCCDTFTISISVDVTPKCVKFPFEDVIISNCVSKFITVMNPVNVKTEFSWKLPESCFIIEPLTATIPSYSSITCFVKYIPHQTLPYCIDATLCSENGAKQIVNLTKLQTDPKIRLRTPSVEFSYISVNTTVKKTTGIENLVNEPMAYVVENPEPIPGISVTPTRGTIPGFGEEIFEIRVRIATCVAFKCPVTVNIQNRTNIEMIIAGTVIYPHIVFKPDVMKLRKIVANSFERQVFVIVNKSNAAVTIDFCLNDYVEYTILESRHIDYYTKPLKRIELEANSQKELYLYFNPMGAALFSFYLPIMINEVFGPAVLNSYQTLSPNFYTTVENAKYVGHNTVQILQLPKRLPILFINSSVGCDILKFSKLNFHFKFYSHRHTNTDAKSDLIIWNASPETCKFCIRTDALRYPFSIQLVSGNDIQFLEYSMVVTLEPKEEITFKVLFDPMLQGAYFVQLPIYLRNYLDGSIFNYLTFSGYYPSPIIFSNEKEVYFEPVPITCETEQKVTLNFEYHSKNCSVATEIDNREIKVQFCEISVYHGEGILTANIKYMSKTSMSIDSSINFYCTCGANYRIYVKGCVENCCVTNHAFVFNYVKQEMYGKSLIGEDVKEQCETASSVISLVSSLSNHNSTSFPFFPSNEDRSEYASHMRSVVIALEEWISHQGFYGKKYFKIPDTFAVSPQPLRLNDFEMKKKKSPPAALNYIGLLVNLIGSIVYNYVTIMEVPLDDLDRINYMYNSYRQALNLVSCQGAYLSHVAPENLLPYVDHVLFIKHIYPNKSEFMGETPPEILSKDNYFLLCKQLWIDVLLQTYKVFVLGRVTVPVKYKKESFSLQRSMYRSINSSIIEKEYFLTDNTLNTTITKISEEELSATSFYPLDDSDFWSIFDDQDKSILYNTSEQVLMRWLEFYSNKQITKWCESSQLKNLRVEKTVTNFDFDLQNGVVLIAVTLEYCSYLAPYLKDIYMDPSCSEQSFHNASKVIQSWNVIGLSFGITPTQINNPNCLHMLMLVNYLYQVLPSFNANNKLMFKTNLSETCSKQILIENISQYAVAYKIIILGNKRKLFSVVNEEFVIQPLKKYKLFITFHAKFLDEETGIMILNGECSGKAYAKTIAVELIGQSIVSYSTTTINIPLNVYEVKTVELDIQSPYVNTAKYEINFSLSEPHKSLSNIFSAASTLHSKIPRRIVFSVSHIDFDELGVGILTVILCSITNNEKSTWIIFRNPSIGDFTINIITTPSSSPGQYLDIQVPLHSGFNRTKCLCRKDQKPTTNPDCPRRLVLKIPCRNEFLWDTCAELILQVVKEEDFNFWKQYLGTRPGVQIIQWLTELEPCVEDYYDIAQVFQTTVKYFVTIENQSPNIIISPISIIRDVLSTDSHELFIHVSEHEHNLKGFTIKMESRSGFEHRYYNIDFISKRSICIQ
ncbi:hypothetical protein RN001_008395 [Aquatica leii]|uniref:Calponin-homology (CH) domain-containing protein n=1 Tax=Aquatica leii TaxID=1421715 RepID=A0AAN7PXC2_9COLE|nr:hypothetical protein RN001_008395 [Aquatica leii]